MRLAIFPKVNRKDPLVNFKCANCTQDLYETQRIVVLSNKNGGNKERKYKPYIMKKALYTINKNDTFVRNIKVSCFLHTYT